MRAKIIHLDDDVLAEMPSGLTRPLYLSSDHDYLRDSGYLIPNRSDLDNMAKEFLDNNPDNTEEELVRTVNTVYLVLIDVVVLFNRLGRTATKAVLALNPGDIEAAKATVQLLMMGTSVMDGLRVSDWDKEYFAKADPVFVREYMLAIVDNDLTEDEMDRLIAEHEATPDVPVEWLVAIMGVTDRSTVHGY